MGPSQDRCIQRHCTLLAIVYQLHYLCINLEFTWQAHGYLHRNLAWCIRAMCQVRRLGGKNGQFWHNRHQMCNWEGKFYKRKKLVPKLVFPPILVVNWVSSCVSFFLSACNTATCIFTAPTCTTSIIALKPCALNVEF
jgi:hypothetical protein